MDSEAVTEVIAKVTPERPLAWVARIGFAARGVVFLTVGGFALLAAGGSTAAQPEGVRDALQSLFEHPFGGIMLWTVAAGLLCFASWRLIQAITDTERFGASAYGLMRRGVFAFSGAFYLALAAATARITMASRGQSEDQSARDWTAWLMAKPLGHVLIGMIAAGFAGVGIGLAVSIFRTPYRKEFDAKPAARAWAVMIGSFGILTRAVVFLMIASFLGFATYDSDSAEVVGLSGALQTLQQQSYGGILLGIAALGLVAFGIFEIIEACVRRVHAPKLAP